MTGRGFLARVLSQGTPSLRPAKRVMRGTAMEFVGLSMLSVCRNQ